MFKQIEALLRNNPLDVFIEGWVIGCFIIALGLVCVDWLSRRGLKKAIVHLERTKNPWDEVLLTASLNPLRLAVWSLGLSLLVDYAQTASRADFHFNVATPRSAGLILAFTMFAFRLLKELEQAFMEGRWQEARLGGQRLDVSTVSAGSRLLRMAVALTMVVAMMQVLGFNITSLLAFGGLGGLVAGFAARDLLANLFGALMVHVDRPFGPGDWIRSPDKNIEGVVENIGWRVTRIRTFNKRVLYVPNAVFSTISVENPSRMTHRRVKIVFGIRYDDAPQLQQVISQVYATLWARPDLDQESTFIIRFCAFGPSSLDILVRVYSKITAYDAYLKLKEAVLFDIMQAVESCGAEFAFPTSTVHLAREEDPENEDMKAILSSKGKDAAFGADLEALDRAHTPKPRPPKSITSKTPTTKGQKATPTPKKKR